MQASSEGFQQCYNAQLAVEEPSQLIVATEVSANASDQGRMVALGFRRFSLHGLKKVHSERDLACLALNVKRTQRLQAA